MKVYIVGTGMNGKNTLTKKAEKAIDEAELLIGAERMLLPFQSMGKELFTSYIPQDIADKLGSCSYGTAAVLMSGDCGFFSGARKLLPLLCAHDVRVISGISSVSYFCSRLGITYEDMKFVSLHGKKSNIAVNVKLNERCFFLLGGDVTAADVCRALCSFGLSSAFVRRSTRVSMIGIVSSRKARRESWPISSVSPEIPISRPWAVSLPKYTCPSRCVWMRSLEEGRISNSCFSASASRWSSASCSRNISCTKSSRPLVNR